MAYITTDTHKFADLKTIGRTARKALTSTADHCLALVRHMQYAQMKAVMDRMPDDVLDEIGISRADIPERARSMVYDCEN